MKEVITNNRVKYAMDILERQSEICPCDKNANKTATNVKQSDDRNDNNKIIKKKIIDTDIGSCAEYEFA